jgi:hypothetical protein
MKAVGKRESGRHNSSHSPNENNGNVKLVLPLIKEEDATGKSPKLKKTPAKAP